MGSDKHPSEALVVLLCLHAEQGATEQTFMEVAARPAAQLHT